MDKLSLIILGSILILHIFIIKSLIFFPYPEFFVYPYLTNNGLKPYQQILDQHFPGLMFFPINLNNLGMTTPDAARIWLILIVLIIHLLIFLISRRIFNSDFKAILVNVLYLIWQPFFEGWVLWIDNFLPLFLLPAFYFIYTSEQKEKTLKNLFLAGFFLGVGVVFKQVLIPLAGIVGLYILLTTKKIRPLAFYSLGFLIPVLIMLLYLFAIGVFEDFWYWTAVFNLTVFAETGRKAAESFGVISRVLMVFGISILAIFSKEKRLVQILLIFLIGSLLAAYARFDFVHFQPSLPFALIATLLGVSVFWNKKHIGKLLTAIYIFVSIWWLNIFFQGHLGDKVLFFDEEVRTLAEKIEIYTQPKEKIFLLGPVLHLYQITDTLPAGDLFVFQFPWFFQVAQQHTLEGMIKDKPNIVLVDRTVVVEGRKITDFAADVLNYIDNNYEQIEKINTTEILRRKLK